MLDTARQILVSELVIAQNSTKEEEVEEAIQGDFPAIGGETGHFGPGENTRQEIGNTMP